MSFLGYLKIARIGNGAMAAIAVYIGAKTAFHCTTLNTPMILALASAFLICGAGNAVNDFFDYEIDKINKPLRPIPGGEVSLQGAKNYSVFLFSAGIALSYFINILAFSIAILNSLLLYFYAAAIKRKGGFNKNILVSYLVASPFLYGGAAVLQLSSMKVIVLSLLAFLANMGREIIKDIEDLKGDAGKASTLPALYGVKISSKFASFFIFLAILLSPLPYFAGFMGMRYLFFILAGDVLFISSIKRLMNIESENANEVQKMLKLAMLLALAAFWIGSE